MTTMTNLPEGGPTTTLDLEIFHSKLEQLSGLIYFAAHNCARPGAAMDADDLAQEGTMLLLEILERYSHVDPESRDWDKIYKTALWHRMLSKIQAAEAGKRDWRKVVRLGQGTRDEDINFLETPQQADLRGVQSTPEDVALLVEQQDLADRFLQELVARIDEREAIVLFELLYPRSQEEVTVLRSDAVGPQATSTYTVAILLDWTRDVVRTALFNIRAAAALLATEWEIEGVDSILADDFCAYVRA